MVEAHLRELGRGLAGGLDVRGYLYWSAFDDVAWNDGYRPRFGLVGIDRADRLRRVVRPSALTLARVARTGRVSA